MNLLHTQRFTHSAPCVIDDAPGANFNIPRYQLGLGSGLGLGLRLGPVVGLDMLGLNMLGLGLGLDMVGVGVDFWSGESIRSLGLGSGPDGSHQHYWLCCRWLFLFACVEGPLMAGGRWIRARRAIPRRAIPACLEEPLRVAPRPCHTKPLVHRSKAWEGEGLE